jgi:hypothetical protein
MRNTIELHKRWKDNPSKGEVFTPEELVKEMLDKIPTSVWENPTSNFLDPCMGKGTFLIDILRRLTTIYGYSKEDAMSRIYGYDVRVKYINYLKRGGFKNVFHKDFLSENIDMKFDVVIGNPPFQNNLENGQKSKKTLWSLFIQKSFELTKQNGYCSMVSPDGWWSPTIDIPKGKISIFRDIFKKYNLLVVASNEVVKPHFKNIGTSFTYFVVQKSVYKNITNFITTDMVLDFDIKNINFIPKKINRISLELHKKIMGSDSKFTFERYQKKDGGMLDNQHPYFYTPKVKFSRGLAKFRVEGDNGNSGYDVFTYAYHISGSETVESAMSVLNSKLYRLVLNQKWNQYFTKFIPNEVHKPSLDKIYTDEMIYQLFDLTDEEIEYVESYVE